MGIFLNQGVLGSLCKSRVRPKPKDTELFFGVHHAQLFRGLRHKLLSVLKAILLEAKVLELASVGMADCRFKPAEGPEDPETEASFTPFAFLLHLSRKTYGCLVQDL